MIRPKCCRIRWFFKNRLGARSTLGSRYFPRVAIFNHILSDLEVLTLIKSELTGWTRASNEVTYTSRGFIYIYHSALKVTKCPLRGSNLCMRAHSKMSICYLDPSGMGEWAPTNMSAPWYEIGTAWFENWSFHLGGNVWVWMCLLSWTDKP